MEATEAYREGVVCYLDGLPNDDNPHPSSNGRGFDRTKWFDGWFDAWRITKWGPNLKEFMNTKSEVAREEMASRTVREETLAVD